MELSDGVKNYKVFRCGKCPACLRQKANELIVRSREEWQGRNVHFLTFTYRYDACPLFNVDWYFVDGNKVVQKSWVTRDTDLEFNSSAPYVLKYNKKGEEYPLKHITNAIKDDNIVLFGAYPFDVDKKVVMMNMVDELILL